MREEDSARRAARRVHLQRGGGQGGRGGARTRDQLARVRVPDLRWPGSLRLTEGVPRGENLSNKYREERTHECRQKSPNDQLRRELLRRVRLFPRDSSGFLRAAPRHITAGFSALAGISLAPSLSFSLALAVLVKYSKLHRAVVHRASLIVARDIAVITRDRG